MRVRVCPADEDRYSEVLRRARGVLEEERAAEESRPATAEALLPDQDYIPTVSSTPHLSTLLSHCSL